MENSVTMPGAGKEMSSVLVNTEKGKRLVEGLTEQRRVEAYSRPVEEPIEGDPQLQHPSFPHKKRALFLREYKKGKEGCCS